ncbi:MAG: copper-binding protein [Isosphaeraceae bacterium]|nr:copper-binding protein [Isosphaeraceae bacterium]
MTLRRFAFLLLAVFVTSGCRRPAPTAPKAHSVTPVQTKTYRVTGTVRAVNPEAKVVTVRHDAIPGYMDAMTMPFRVRDKAVLEDVRPGDEVEGTLRVDRDESELTELTVTRPAPAQSLSLKLAGNGASIQATSRLIEVGETVPDFTLTTQEGKGLKLSDLRGKVVVLTFIYTRCPLPDFCPLMDRKFAELAGSLSAFPERAERVRLLSVSFDPEHDTPDILSKHAAVQGAKPPLWMFAVASHPELAKVAPGLGLTYGPTANEVIHNLVTVVIGPDGKLAARESGSTGKTWKPLDVLKVVHSLLTSRKDAGGGHP